MKKFVLRIMAWLMAVAMILPSAGVTISTQAAENYKSSVTYTATGGWAEKELTLSDLIGNVDPEDVTAVKFSSDVNFQAGYNATSGSWKWGDAGKSYTAKDIRFDDWFAFKFAITAGDDKDYTINWEVLTGEEAAPVETPKASADGEDFPVETIVNNSWGVYSNEIPASTLEKYEDGMVIEIDFTVDSGANYALLSPVISTDGWPKLVDYVTGVTFNSDDGSYIAFGPDDNTVKMTLTKEGVEEVITKGTGLIFQAYQLQFDKVTLSSAAPKATPTPTPKPTATPAPTKAPAATDEPVATPVPTKAPEFAVVGDELLVTEDMVKDGIVVIKDAKYNTIVIGRDVDATTIRLADVKAGEVKVESGADYEIALFNSDVEELNVTAPVVEGISKNVLLQMIKDKVVLTEEMLLSFMAYTETAKAVEKLQPVIKAYGTSVDKANIDGNVKLYVTGCDVTVNAKNAEAALNVELVGFAGNVDVTISGADGGFCLTNLTLTDSDAATVNVSGTDGSCYIGGNSELDKVQVSGADAVTVAVDAKEVAVEKKAEDAKIRLYGNVGTVTAAGKKNDIILGSAAKVATANVTGDGIRVYGYGKLENAEITGKEANVAVPGALVNGENDETIPAAMKEMNPWKDMVSNKKKPAASEPEAPTTPEEPEYESYELTTEPNGDWGIKTNAIPVDFLEDYTGGAKITLVYTTDGTDAYPSMALKDATAGWPSLAEYTPGATYNSYGFINVSMGSTELEITLSAEGVQSVIDNGSGMLVQGAGILLTEARFVALGEGGNDNDEEEESTEITLFEGDFTPTKNDWSESVTIAAEKFNTLQFDNSEKLVITYKVTGDADSQLKFGNMSDGWKDILIIPLVAGKTTTEVILTADWADLVTGGVALQGPKGFTIEMVKAVGRNADDTSIWNGSTSCGTAWSTSIQLSADKFSNLSFDGSEALLITYQTEDAGVGYTQIQFCNMASAGWEKIVNTNIQNAYIDCVLEVPLTSAYEAIATDGLAIQGVNWTITDVSISVK